MLFRSHHTHHTHHTHYTHILHTHHTYAPHTPTHTHSRWLVVFNVKRQTLKLLGDHVGEYTNDIRHKKHKPKRKIDRLDFIKINKSHSSKDRYGWKTNMVEE